MVRRVLVGDVFVDHGGVAIVDPEHAVLSDRDDGLLLNGGAGVVLDCGAELPEGVDHAGVFVATGLGDGKYPVYAELVSVPGAGERVARIVVDCLGVEDESGELRERLAEGARTLREHGLDVRLPFEDREVLS